MAIPTPLGPLEIHASVMSARTNATRWWDASPWRRFSGPVIEDLRFTHGRDVRAKFNRVTHQFDYRTLLTAIDRQSAREGVALRKAHLAYTSMIGRFQYQPRNTGLVCITPGWTENPPGERPQNLEKLDA